MNGNKKVTEGLVGRNQYGRSLKYGKKEKRTHYSKKENDRRLKLAQKHVENRKIIIKNKNNEKLIYK